MKLYETVDWFKVEMATPCLVWNEGGVPVLRDFCGMLNGKPVFHEGEWTCGLPVMMALDEMSMTVAKERDVSARLGAALLKWRDIAMALDEAMTSFGGHGAQAVRERPGVARALRACADLRAQRKAVQG